MKTKAKPKCLSFITTTERNKFKLASAEAGFQFNTMGILNLPKDEPALYQVKARIGDHTFAFNGVDWSQTTLKNVRIKQDDTIIPASFSIHQNSCIVYLVSRYLIETETFDQNYAFAVQPITQKPTDKL